MRTLPSLKVSRKHNASSLLWETTSQGVDNTDTKSSSAAVTITEKLDAKPPVHHEVLGKGKGCP